MRESHANTGDPTAVEAEKCSGTRSPGAPRPSRRRLFIRLGLVGGIGLIGLMFLFVLSTVLASVSSDGETNDVFTEAAELPPTLISAVTWLPDSEDSPRPMEPLTRTDVSATWLRAWAQIAIVAETGETSGLEVYFSNSALKAMLAAVDDWAGRPIHQIGHELQLSFYSEDGQVIGLTATKANLLRTAVVDGQTEYFNAEESYEAILILEDGNWRVQHWVRRTANGHWPTGSIPAATESIHEDVTGPTVELFDSESYSTIEQQLDNAVDSGATAVRVSVDNEAFELGQVDDGYLANLNEFLDLASERELKVVASLFDRQSNHPPSQWNADVRRLKTLVPVLASHRSVVIYELAHEADLGVSAGSDAGLVDAWLAHVGRAARAIDADKPIMITWSNREAAIDARVTADVVGFTEPNPIADSPGLIGQMNSDDGHHIIVRSVEAARQLPPPPRGPLTKHPLVRLGVLACVGLGTWAAVRKIWPLRPTWIRRV